MTAIILEVVLGILTNLTFGEIIYISLAVTLVAYIIGDLMILAVSNNTVATIADAGIALFTIYMFNYVWNFARISFTDALISAVVLGVGEIFFHKYTANRVFPNHEHDHD